MIRVGAALLCDAATIREGVLNILGGGISLIGFPGFPAPIASTLAILLYVNAEPGVAQDYIVRGSLRNVRTGDASDVFRVEGNVTLQLAGEHASSIVVGLGGVAVHEAGTYALDLCVNDSEQFSVPFTAIDASEAVKVLSGGDQFDPSRLSGAADRA